MKTLISVGGWAETGGYFDDSGKRVNSGGFYSMATNADGSVNQAGIDTFADSAVSFIRKYGFNGVDIDYEYPTTMKDAGNPLDWSFANARRAGLVKGYAALMKTLREKLDRAGAADGKHYLLSVAAPSSGYLLRGMETFQVQRYLDYVNIMSYDLHGAWNEYVGPNASLFDDGKDAELAAANVYGSQQYGGIGYLNTDWAYHYFRGSMLAWPHKHRPALLHARPQERPGRHGRPVGQGGGHHLPGLLGLTKCGDGAVGIDNLWHDKDDNGKESPAGSNPMWHAKNLEKGIVGDYVTKYGFPAGTKLTGTYARKYDATLVAPWLWNAEKKVFLSTEDEQSVAAKADYVVDRGIGGTMVWELAGDYDWNAAKGQYETGDTLTSLMYEKFKSASPYGAKVSNKALPAKAVNIGVEFGEFKLGDSNYPITPKVKITNNTKTTLPGGTEFQFDYSTAAPANASDAVRLRHQGDQQRPHGQQRGRPEGRLPPGLAEAPRLAVAGARRVRGAVLQLLPAGVHPVELDGEHRGHDLRARRGPGARHHAGGARLGHLADPGPDQPDPHPDPDARRVHRARVDRDVRVRRWFDRVPQGALVEGQVVDEGRGARHHRRMGVWQDLGAC
ncbi:hypothetical protein SGLAM104S_01115 [Streptomyces glaucescens]